MPKYTFLLIIALLALPVYGQERGVSVGWDLSYESILTKNNVAGGEPIRIWLKRSKAPAESWLTESKSEGATAAVLIEYPAFHAGERTTMLLFRTETKAFYWELVEGQRWGRNEEPIRLEVFDTFFKEVSTWQQNAPKRADETPEQAFPGYMGFLSQSDPTGSRQILLTLDDFFVCPDRKCERGKTKIGRLMTALEPILRPEEEKSYKHKTESEIARMSVEKRIDEQIREYASHGTEFSDKHGELIQKYLLRDGANTFPQLIKLMDGYNPRRLRDSSPFIATRIAVEIDETVFRLRSTEQGRRVIEVMKRLNARMEAEAGKGSGLGFDVETVTGINSKDYAIADALWLSYRINMTESELLDFTNHLIKNAPDYPSWSDTEYRRNMPRSKESAFKHTQGPVVKEPLRYYQSYLVFKRTTEAQRPAEGGIRVLMGMGAADRDIFRRFGRPVADERRGINPCGGPKRQLSYAGLTFTLDKNEESYSLIEVDVTSPKWDIGRGIRIGASRRSVRAAFGAPSIASKPDALIYGDGDGTVAFRFRNHRLARVTRDLNLC